MYANTYAWCEIKIIKRGVSVKLTNQLPFNTTFQKVDQHMGRKWFVHCTKLTVHHPARVTVVNLAKMAETGALLRHVFPAFMC